MHFALSFSFLLTFLSILSNWNETYMPSRPYSPRQITFQPGILHISRPTLDKHVFSLSPKKCASGHFLYLFSLLLLNASDCHPNPGPRPPKYPCGECGKACTWSRTVRSIECTNCRTWFHKDCLQMPSLVFNALEGSEISWNCCQCGLANLHSSLFMDYEDPASCTTPSATSFMSSDSSLFGSPQFTSSPSHSRRKQPTAKKKLRVLVINCQSIRAKKESFWALLEQAEPDIVLASETWLNPSIAEREIQPDNYCFVSRRDRPTDRTVRMVEWRS